MKKNNRKGFTIVELVIVIAVIAILAAVLIPTFSNVIAKANNSKALQNARNAYTSYTADFNYSTGAVPAQNLIVKVSDNAFVAVKGAQMDDTVYTTEADALEAIDEDAAKAGSGSAAFTADNGITIYAVCANHADGADADATCDACGGTIA